MEQMIGMPKVIEAPVGLYFLIRMGSLLEVGGVSVVLRTIGLSDHPKQIRIPKSDWELLKKEIDGEFGLTTEILEEEIEEE